MDRGQSISELTVSRTSAEPDRAASQAPFVSPGPNPIWLARAKLFELPGRLCKRGHDISKEGTYLVSYTRKGQKRETHTCRRCRIEDVQFCVAKKKLSDARKRSFEKAA